VADDFRVTVEGHRELRKAIRQVGDKELTKGLKEAHKETASIVVPPARQEAPVRSGRLSASIKPSSTVKGAVVRAGTAKGVPYAAPVHFGWPKRDIRANKFLFGAAGKTRDTYRAVFEERIAELVRRFINSD
jgi:hypothetical protein